MSLNIKFAVDSSLGTFRPESENANNYMASVQTDDGEWLIQSTELSSWWELAISPNTNEVFAILWKTPFMGVVLGRCKKNKAAIDGMVAWLPMVDQFYDIATKKEFELEQVENIIVKTASPKINRSIQGLQNEAKFLQKKITGEEIMGCVVRPRQLIKRAWKTHRDAFSQIWIQTIESSVGQDEKKERGIQCSKKKVPNSKSALPSLLKGSNAGSPHKGKAGKPQQGGDVHGSLHGVPRKNRNRKVVGS